MYRRLFPLACSWIAASCLSSYCAPDVNADEGAKEAPTKIEVLVVGEPEGTEDVLVLNLTAAPELWLGIQLSEDNGQVKVEQVVPDSPAAKAGLKPNDIVVAGGDTPVTEGAALKQLVQASAGKPLTLKIRRDGNELSVEVKPEQRPGEARLVLTPQGDAPKAEPPKLPQRLRLWTETPHQPHPAPLPPVAPQAPGGGWQVVPAPRVAYLATIPDDLEVVIKRKGNGPARIKIRQGEHKWSVKENQLDQLPPHIRAHVARMLPSHGGPHFNVAVPAAVSGTIYAVPHPPGQPGQPVIGIVPPPAPPAPPAPPGPPPHDGAAPRGPAPDNHAAIMNEILQLKQQLHELRMKVESLPRR